MPKPYTSNDQWSRRAAAEGYRARSVYKLMELDERFHLLKSGMTVLDLGAAPGSWLQYTAKKIGPKGLVIGIDVVPIKAIAPHVITLQHDITKIDDCIHAISEAIASQKKQSSDSFDSSDSSLPTVASAKAGESSRVDLVLSDIAPNTSGIKDIDQWRSVALARTVLTIALTFLKPHGTCVVKVFRGADFDEFLRGVRRGWEEVKTVTVKASRDRSREVYLVLKKSHRGVNA